MNGFMGKLLFVDLSKKELKDIAPDKGLYRQFIGGYGLGARIIFSKQRAGIDPLGQDNILGIVTGPLTGTQALSGTRHTVVGKSPLTSTWGDSNSGGFFGAYLKFAGYDGVFVTGTSNDPVYILIDNGKAEIRNASHLWNKDTYITDDALKSELGKEVQVACIGPSGEKRCLISAIVHDKGRVAGRSGLGAVMGSKKLKAIAVTGSLEAPVADPKKVSALREKYIKELSGPIDLFRKYGTPGGFIPIAEEGDAPTKNWLGYAPVDLPDYRLIGGDAVIAKVEKKYACYRCPIGCGGLMKKGKMYEYEAGVHKPEYETIAMLGSNCLNADLESVIKMNDICNRYGLDTISVGATIAFVIECFEKGVITKADTDGLEMTWGNSKAIVAMTEKLAKREGFGDLIADGVKITAERISKLCNRDLEEYAIHIGGQEVPAHTPLVAFPFVVSYRLEATPARHTQHPEHMHPPELFGHSINPKSFNAEIHKKGRCFLHTVASAGMCQFVYGCLPTIKAFIEFLNAVTGWDTALEELIKTGERIANIRHAFNIREGINPLKYKISGRLLGRPPYKVGPLAGLTIDEETENRWIREYLVAMGWDLETAKPSKQKLQELGLNDIVNELYQSDGEDAGKDKDP